MLQNPRRPKKLWLTCSQIDYIPFTHAVHRLSGIVTPASAAYSAQEFEHQLRSSNAKAIFTCIPLLETALKAAEAVNIPNDRIFLLPVPGVDQKTPYATVEDLIQEGKSLPELEPLKWVKGQGARQVAYLCYSSGTSGLPVSEAWRVWILLARLTPTSESRYDLTPKRHCERYSVQNIRVRRQERARY